jgi:hypothetical protein
MEMLITNETREPKFNMYWGPDFMLMDCHAFMGGIGGSGYDKIIGMFDRIWNTEKEKIINKFYLSVI